MPLLVPPAPTPAMRLPRTMARKKFLKLLRLMKYAKEAHLRALFTCPRCNAVVKLARGAGLIELTGVQGGINEKVDTFSLSCSCTVWTVRA